MTKHSLLSFKTYHLKSSPEILLLTLILLFDLQGKPPWYTLSNYFDISKKTVPVSRLVPASKTCMSCTIDRSYLVQESFGWKPNWWSDKSLLSCRKLKRHSNINFSSFIKFYQLYQVFFAFLIDWTNIWFF